MDTEETYSKTFKRPGARPGDRRRARPSTKGRQVDETALGEVEALLERRSRDRQYLIEHLHLIQDRYNCLSYFHLAALARVMGLPQAEVFEVATFYHHFDVVQTGEQSPPPVTIRVCDSLSCALAGAEGVIAVLREKAGDNIRVVPAPCMGRCQGAPAAAVGGHYKDGIEAQQLLDLATGGVGDVSVADYAGYDTYCAQDGYQALNDCRSGKYTPAGVIEQLDRAGLRGLGGAGFPSGQKWQFVRAEPGPRYVTVNADEGEPGTFKDRHYLETEPHRFLEGALIAAWGVEATALYIYLRDEYPAVREILLKEIDRLEQAKVVDRDFIHLRRGAGAYICGEESAMIESIEGKRGLPRHRPPYVAQVGLFGRPTLVHNVETLYWIPEILQKGAQAFADRGTPDHKGVRSYSVSGRVARPGVVLAPAGVTAAELIDEYCGGMAEGHTFKAYLPGGASGGILPASMSDLALDFGVLEPHGCFVGSHAVIVLSDQDNVAEAALNLMRFFEHESCGQCTPCRVGCEKAAHLMSAGEWDGTLLNELAEAMADASICGLGQAAPNPMLSALKHFPGDVAAMGRD